VARRCPALAALFGFSAFALIAPVSAQRVSRSSKQIELAPVRVVTSAITANALRGDVSFLASDLLEGRDTPSRGLDVAAEYIASAFRRMGVDQVGDSFYQPVLPMLRGDFSTQNGASNVIGVLRGSDPVLKDTYVILSAHYDHRGLAKTGDDRVLNGANDDASGVASVLEIANALAALPQRPKRSVLFLLFCGEEKGLLGSLFYASHPLVPLDHTVAQINLEQMGRTDSPEAPHVNMMNVTGFDYSSVTVALIEAGKLAKIDVLKNAEASDEYFRRSDNGPLADAGIPAHTVSVTYEFPDYHQVGDEWQKLDYDNMARVDRTVALAALQLASDVTPPKWAETNPKTQRFVEAAKKLRQ